MSAYPPSFQACRLFRKKSEKGSTYFVGRWGGARVTLLKSKDVADDGSEVWNLLLSEAPAKKPAAEQSAVRSPAKRAAAPASGWQAPLEPAETRGEGRKPSVVGDGEIPF
jgi:hypothetical protein